MTQALRSHFDDYAAFHRTAGNRVCHSFGIPIIVLASLALLARVPLFSTLGLTVTLAEVLIALFVAYYLTLDAGLAALGSPPTPCWTSQVVSFHRCRRWGSSSLADIQLIAATQGPWAERCLGDALTAGAWHNKPAWYVLAAHGRPECPGRHSCAHWREGHSREGQPCADAVASRGASRSRRTLSHRQVGWCGDHVSGVQASAPGVYRGHRPETTALYEVVRDNLETLFPVCVTEGQLISSLTLMTVVRGFEGLVNLPRPRPAPSGRGSRGPTR